MEFQRFGWRSFCVWPIKIFPRVCQHGIQLNLVQACLRTRINILNIIHTKKNKHFCESLLDYKAILTREKYKECQSFPRHSQNSLTSSHLCVSSVSGIRPDIFAIKFCGLISVLFTDIKHKTEK